jgi:hypothetical protein
MQDYAAYLSQTGAQGKSFGSPAIIRVHFYVHKPGTTQMPFIIHILSHGCYLPMFSGLEPEQRFISLQALIGIRRIRK